MRSVKYVEREGCVSPFDIDLILHVSGAIGAFISVGIWLFGLSALRRAQRADGPAQPGRGY